MPSRKAGGPEDLGGNPSSTHSLPPSLTPPKGKETQLSEPRPQTQNKGALRGRSDHTRSGGPKLSQRKPPASGLLGSCLPQGQCRTDQPSRGPATPRKPVSGLLPRLQDPPLPLPPGDSGCWCGGDRAPACLPLVFGGCLPTIAPAAPPTAPYRATEGG